MKITVVDLKTGQEKSMPDAHARILERLGRVRYMTRDMVAEPAQTARPPAAVDLDSAGDAWNADLHVSTKTKNADGTWRKKPGARKD